MRLRTWTTIVVIFVAGALVVGAVPSLIGDRASAWEQPPPCDFLTGGGWILPPWNSGSVKANFAIGGGCKHGSGTGSPPIPYWGHLNYLDHGTTIKPATAPTPFHVHWTDIDAYVFIDDGTNGTDPKTHQPVGTREVCGRATTNDPAHPMVQFRVHEHDDRSEEHTSELQSHSDLVCRLLLEKKKTKTKQITRKTKHH